MAIDVVKRVDPGVSEKRLFTATKGSIVVAGIVGGIIVSSGVDYVALVTLVFFIKAALILPLGLAIFWPRMTGPAFVISLFGALAVGLPIRESVGELQGIEALLATSLVLSVGISLLQQRTYDYRELTGIEDLGAAGTDMPAAPPAMPAPRPLAGQGA